jgi:hypothetical protein
MMKRAEKKTAMAAFGCAVLLLTLSTSARALDAAKDRRGLFWGMGFGGGGSLMLPSADAGGHVLFDLQLGAGVSKHVTLGFDVDVAIVIFEGVNNTIITPGPEINFFLGDSGLFVRGGVGVAMSVVKAGNDSDFAIGFDVGAGFGWEFFANTNLALGVAAEVDYIVRQGQDLMMFGFMFDLKYY